MSSSVLPVAKSTITPTVPAIMVRGLSMMFCVVLTLGAAALSAQEPPLPKPPGDEHGKPPRGPGGPRFGMGGGMRESGWDQLNEDEKKKLREAIDKVWDTAEVAASRDKIMKATEEMRTTLRTALEKSDPDAAKIMAKVKTPFPWPSHRGPPPMPNPEDPNFPRMATMRLGFEMLSIAKPEQREAMRHLHERLVELPSVKDAAAKLEAAPISGRMEAFKMLRETYQKEREREIAEYRARRRDSAPEEDKK